MEKDCRIEELEIRPRSVEEFGATLASMEAFVTMLVEQKDGGGE